MSAATDQQIPALAEALRLLNEGLWPIPITDPTDPRDWIRDPGKQPAAGTGWGLTPPTEEWLRDFWTQMPGAGVGLLLGKAGRVVDIEVDDPATGEPTLLELFGGEIVETRGWMATRGRHHLFWWDDRLAGIGVKENDPRFPGLGLRFGSANTEGSQVQSVVPPSLTTRVVSGRVIVGPPREWNGIDTIAHLPERFFAELSRRLDMPKVGSNGKHNGATFSVPPDGDVINRAIAYLNRCPEAIQGEQGDKQTFKVVCKVGPGFDLDPGTAYRLIMTHYNPRCVPPWTEKEIQHKVRCAYQAESRRGWLLAEDDPFGATWADLLSRSVHNEECAWKFPEWEPPRDDAEKTIIPFPLGVLPVSLQDLCRAAAEAHHCPVDFFAASALVLAGSAIGRSVCLRVTSTWEVQPNLFLAIVGDAGSRKSPALKLMAAPLFRIDRDLYLMWKVEHDDWKDADPRSRGPEPIHRHLVLDDSTREAVARHLGENPRGLVYIKDELTSWVSALNVYRQGKGDDQQFWMSLNSGSYIKVTRKGTTEAIRIPSPCMSVLGPLPPDCLPLLRSGYRADGWLDRILFVVPDAPKDAPVWGQTEVPEDLLESWDVSLRSLWEREMIVDDLDFRPRPFYVQMDAPGEGCWSEFYNDHHAEQHADDFPRSLRGPWSKLEGFALRFALILNLLHQAYDPDRRDCRPGPIGAIDVWGAAQLVAYFKVHFRRARGMLRGYADTLSMDACLVLKWIQEKRLEEFTVRDVGQKFRRFDDRDRSEALAELERMRYVRYMGKIRSGGKPGRSSEVYVVNPHVLKNTPQ